MSRPIERKLRVCVHEAGHAVIALDSTSGSARVRLMISPDGGLSGQTTESPGPRHKWRCSPYFRRALVAAAGELAEEKYFGSAPPPWCVETDHQRLADYAVSLGLDEDAMLRDVRKRVCRAFNDERIWRQVIAVAGALFAAWPIDAITEVTEVSEAELREVIAMVTA
jgi:hypothetical protein